MKISHKIGFISTIAAALLFSGCGEGGSSATPADAPQTASSKVVTVERGPLLDANVTDAEGNVAIELGDGKYAFENDPVYPIYANGGYIDVNRDGTIDPGEVKNELTLKTQEGSVVTIATTLAADAEKQALLEEQYNLTKEQINTQTPGESEDIEAFSNTIYQYVIENGYTDPSKVSADELKTLVSDFKATLQSYKNDAHTPENHEQALMNTLSLVTLDDADAQQAQEQFENMIDENKQKYDEFFNQFANHSQNSSSSQAALPGQDESSSQAYSSEMGHEGYTQGSVSSNSYSSMIGGMFGNAQGDTGSSYSSSAPEQHNENQGQTSSTSYSSVSNTGHGSSQSASYSSMMGGTFGNSQGNTGYSYSSSSAEQHNENQGQTSSASYSSSSSAPEQHSENQGQTSSASYSSSSAASQQHIENQGATSSTGYSSTTGSGFGF